MAFASPGIRIVAQNGRQHAVVSWYPYETYRQLLAIWMELNSLSWSWKNSDGVSLF
jgi:hypothetical protein